MVLLAAAVAALGSCGSGSLSSLLVKLTPNQDSAIKDGDTPSFTLSIVNNGPEPASGVSARVDLPDGVTYVATNNIDVDPYGVLRSLPQDPAVRTSNPSWGVWTLNAPVTQADGTVRRPHVDISFTVNVNARPGGYQMVPHIFSDSADGELVGKGTDLQVGPSGHLDMTIAAVPNRVKRNDQVTYLLTVTNNGSGPASGVDVLVTLPDILSFVRTDRIGGNAARSKPTDPSSGAILVDYGGWTIPPAGNAGPGRVTIVFKALVIPSAYAGKYTVSLQVTDASGVVSSVNDTAQIIVDAPSPPTATPATSPTPAPGGRGYRRLPATPAPVGG